MDFISEMADAGSTEDVAVELARVARCSELFTKDGAAALKGRKRLVKAGMVFYSERFSDRVAPGRQMVAT